MTTIKLSPYQQKRIISVDKLNSSLLFIVGLWLGFLPGFGQVRLARIFTEHAVLQRQKPLPVWGWAAPGELITVSLAGRILTVRAASDSTWRVVFAPLEAGGPFQLRTQSKRNTITIGDVLIGEVWICSGQSNMAFKLKAALNAETEIQTATDPLIRQFVVTPASTLTPAKDVMGTWTVCSSKTAGEFTAVGYFFARQLRKELNVPIGLVNSSWGGTHAETWTSREGLNRDEEFRAVVSRIPTDGERLKRARLDSVYRRVLEKQGGYLPDPAQVSRFADPQTDTRSWPVMEDMPAHWERRGLAGLKGVVWFRKEVVLNERTNLGRASIQLGPIGETDSTFVNGHFVGSVGERTIPRQYFLPQGLLRPGRNVIAVRITDSLMMGGFIGAVPARLRLVTADTTVSLAGSWQFMPVQVFLSSANRGPNELATQLFNGMIHPLIPMALRGVIWYQGEANAPRAYQYRRTFPLLIEDWRQQWSRTEGTTDSFPFLFVQLANFRAMGGDSRQGSSWAELREAQAMALKLPNTGMAVTSDIGEPGDIHPKNKQEVGRRLAAEGLRVAYGRNQLSAGPTFSRLKIEGNQAVIDFTNVGSGLTTPDKYGYLRGFELAGKDQLFYAARAEIKGNQVVVWSDSVAVPVAIRYGWADDNGEVNLYNKEGFPGVPFRTDAWKGLTEGIQFH